jgi:hypothetical protein
MSTADPADDQPRAEPGASASHRDAAPDRPPAPDRSTADTPVTAPSLSDPPPAGTDRRMAGAGSAPTGNDGTTRVRRLGRTPAGGTVGGAGPAG